MSDPLDEFAKTLKALRETSKTDADRTLKALREASQHDTAVRSMVAQIGTALSDLVVLLDGMNSKPSAGESMQAVASMLREGLTAMRQDPPVVNVPAPVVKVEPVMRSDWTSLHVEMAVNAMGRPTGSMTITKVK